MKDNFKTNILGTTYELVIDAEEKDYPKLKGLSGYTDFSIKKIIIRKLKEDSESLEDLKCYQKEVLRHELLHAYFYESGLDSNSEFARNEELIDWIAIQFEKILQTYIDVDAVKMPEPTINIEASLNEDKLIELIDKNIKDLVNFN